MRDGCTSLEQRRLIPRNFQAPVRTTTITPPSFAVLGPLSTGIAWYCCLTWLLPIFEPDSLLGRLFALSQPQDDSAAPIPSRDDLPRHQPPPRAASRQSLSAPPSPSPPSSLTTMLPIHAPRFISGLSHGCFVSSFRTPKMLTMWAQRPSSISMPSAFTPASAPLLPEPRPTPQLAPSL